MKKSDFVAAVLKESCSLVNEDQVLQNLEIFMKLGMMLPPKRREVYRLDDEGIHYTLTYKFNPDEDGDHINELEEG
jgi:hypothetical protein